MARPQVTEGQFWSRVDKSGGPEACWPWTWGRNSAGYGHTARCGRVLRAHRVALEYYLGRPPVGNVLHSCDNPPCCNPTHLREGTQLDNSRDMVSRGRCRPGHVVGSRHGCAKLTESDVVDILELVKEFNQTAVAAMYEVNQKSVCNIVNGYTWKHVPRAQK